MPHKLSLRAILWLLVDFILRSIGGHYFFRLALFSFITHPEILWILCTILGAFLALIGTRFNTSPLMVPTRPLPKGSPRPKVSLPVVIGLFQDIVTRGAGACCLALIALRALRPYITTWDPSIREVIGKTCFMFAFLLGFYGVTIHSAPFMRRRTPPDNTPSQAADTPAEGTQSPQDHPTEEQTN